MAQLLAPGAIESAADRTFRGKRRRPDVAWAQLHRAEVVDEIRCRLTAGEWSPSPFEVLWVRDPKPRAIARAPIADRIVHTALVDVLTPCFAPSLMPEDFACRVGFGSHRAVLALQRLMGRHRWALHLDVRAYFPSISHDIVAALLARRCRDPEFLRHLESIAREGARIYLRPDVRQGLGLNAEWPSPDGRHGLPVGAATSQFLAAHVYLNGLDHFVKRELRVPGYVRYVDDLFLFTDARVPGALDEVRRRVADWLADERSLRLKHPDAPVLSTSGTLDALGYRITRGDRIALPRATRRLRARVSQYLAGDRPHLNIERCIASYAGLMLF